MAPLRIALAALAATLAACAAAPAAQGASRLVVSGAGFGHGIGMSQYGAMGYAQQGADHAAILAHYYTGTQLGSLGGPSEVRVLLKTAARVRFSGAASVAGSRRLDPAQTYTTVRGLSGGVLLRTAGGRDLGTYRAPLVVTGGPGGLLLRGRAQNDVSNGRYRGNLEIRPAAIGGVSAINALDLESYVRGVVAGEMPSSWPAEALRTQAVAARTYALATTKAGDGFDQYADTRSQMYKGIDAETATTDAAVTGTQNEIVVFDGKPIVTYYFSTSGGRTENIENSFLGAEPEPYLVSVDDPYDAASPRHRWVKRMSLRGAQRRLGSLVKGSLRRIRVLQRGRSPRVVRAQVVGTGGTTTVSGPQLRRKLGLFDTWARFTVVTSKGARGDGDTPQAPATPGAPTGGTAPRAISTFAAVALPVAGTISGAITPLVAGAPVAIERWSGTAWVTQFDVAARPSGRYSAIVRRSGLYRVRQADVIGPPVRIGD
jgi:stage II sporulation protein D